MSFWSEQVENHLAQHPEWATAQSIRLGIAEDLRRVQIWRSPSSRELPPPPAPPLAVVKETLLRKLYRREVVCKLGTRLRPYWISRGEFEIRYREGGGSSPPLPTDPVILQRAEEFNRRVDEAWAQENLPLPVPFVGRGSPESPEDGEFQTTGEPAGESPPEEPVAPITDLFGGPTTHPVVGRLLWVLFGDRSPIPPSLFPLITLRDLERIVQVGLVGLISTLEERKRNLPNSLEERYFNSVATSPPGGPPESPGAL